ncbi:MAG: flagellar basal body L-ring protein FlgH [Alphaproteobacteria bacterium]|nr:flagellar basal body L-ring protein FlgH [Alphaproteobacteria bacterium]
MNAIRILIGVALVASLGGCSALDKLARVGEAPTLTAIADPTAQPGYNPVTMPMPAADPVAYQANSLYRSDAKGFFKDQRARKIGDILTIKVTISDQAKFANQTSRTRSSTSETGVGGVLGSVFNSVAPADVTADAAVTTSSGLGDSGVGSVNRSETLNTQIAAVITQVLPNGNLVIEGRQEVRVNFEVRDLIVAGIVRPEDIANDNTIESAKIAEARIAYGGRGQITDVQQPRYGTQILDAILPF